MPFKKMFKKKPVNKVSKPIKKEIHKEIKTALKVDDELKQFAASNTAGVYTGGGSVWTAMITPSVGTSVGTRIGDNISLKSLEVRLGLYILPATTATNPYVNVRVFIVQYMNTAVTPTGSEMLLSSAMNSGSTYGTFSAYNIDYVKIYNVLWDKTFHLEQGTINAANYGQTGKLGTFLKFHVPLSKAHKKIQFLAGSVNASNQLYLYVTSDLASTTFNPVFQCDWNARYTDA